jgi:hypothetical protein
LKVKNEFNNIIQIQFSKLQNFLIHITIVIEIAIAIEIAIEIDIAIVIAF